MHARLLVLVQAESSLDAREQARLRLELEGFIGEGGMFSSPPADWFVIGGRWSGELAFPEGMANYYAALRQKGLQYYGKEGEAAALFHEMFPDYDAPAPTERDQYKDLGYDDDAQPYAPRFLEGLDDYCDGGDLHQGNCYVELDDDPQWVVVVDFHS